MYRPNAHHDDSIALVAEAEATNREPLDPRGEPLRTHLDQSPGPFAPVPMLSRFLSPTATHAATRDPDSDGWIVYDRHTLEIVSRHPDSNDAARDVNERNDDDDDDDDTDPEPVTHYHVTAHIPGCLNDTNDGPYLAIESAREAAAELAATYYGEDTYTVETGNRFEWIASPSEESYRDYGSGYLISVEECTEPACLELDYEPF